MEREKGRNLFKKKGGEGGKGDRWGPNVCLALATEGAVLWVFHSVSKARERVVDSYSSRVSYHAIECLASHACGKYVEGNHDLKHSSSSRSQGPYVQSHVIYLWRTT